MSRTRRRTVALVRTYVTAKDTTRGRRYEARVVDARTKDEKRASSRSAQESIARAWTGAVTYAPSKR